MPIIDGRPDRLAADWWFYPSTGMNQMMLSLAYDYDTNSMQNHYISEVTSGDVNVWRHVAVSTNGKDAATFFMNGKALTLQRSRPGAGTVAQPDGLRLLDSVFRGSMACVSVYKRQLSEVEVAEVMKMCT